MISIISEPLQEYLIAKETAFKGNPLADKLRNVYPKILNEILENTERYKVIGSPGKGNWTDNPWIAILDTIITETPQSGFYPVFLFTADMSGVYLSLNQGVTEVKEYYKKETKQVLRLRAQDFRARINYFDELLTIDLKSESNNARLYEAGNIIAKYYPAKNLPSNEELKIDVQKFLTYYNEMLLNNNQFDIRESHTVLEQKKLRLHYRIERNTSISKKVKKIKGFTCEGCKFNFAKNYGELGKDYIEAHHLKPISTLELGKFTLDAKEDFVVLCANCHRMVHRLDDPSDITKLRNIINIMQSSNV